MEPSVSPRPFGSTDLRATATRLEHVARQLPTAARRQPEKTVRLLRAEADRLRPASPANRSAKPS